MRNFKFVEQEDNLWKNIKKSSSDGLPSTAGGDRFVSGINFEDGVLSYTYFDDITYSNGTLTCKQYIMESDERLKTDIKDIKYDGELPEIIQFRWKDTSALSYGVIA